MSASHHGEQHRAARPLRRRSAELYGREVPAYRHAGRGLPGGEPARHRPRGRGRRTPGKHRPRDRGTARSDPRRHARELAQVARVFGALGMTPCGLLRPARRGAGTRSRWSRPPSGPLDRAELAANPFRVFTSMLVPRGPAVLRRRPRGPAAELPGRPRALPRRAAGPGRPAPIEHGELSEAEADALPGPGRRGLRAVRRAGRPGVVRRAGAHLRRGRRHRRGDHHPHQPPHPAGARHRRPLPAHAGPRHRDDRRDPGPAAVGRARTCCCARRRSARSPSRAPSSEPDGTITAGALRVRFGEVEARGIALTPAGRDRFDELVAAVDRRLAADPDLSRADVAPQVWSEGLPSTERDLCLSGLGFFTFRVEPGVVAGRPTPEQGQPCSAGRLPRSSGLVSCTPSRSCTRTSCPGRPPASSPRT